MNNQLVVIERRRDQVQEAFFPSASIDIVYACNRASSTSAVSSSSFLKRGHGRCNTWPGGSWLGSHSGDTGLMDLTLVNVDNR